MLIPFLMSLKRCRVAAIHLNTAIFIEGPIYIIMSCEFTLFNVQQKYTDQGIEHVAQGTLHNPYCLLHTLHCTRTAL